MAIETPSFTIIQKESPFELRRYASFVTATVEVNGRDYRDAVNQGFSPLASYIFGENTTAQKINMTTPVMAKESSEKIAMTAPVIVSGKGTFQVSFIMPKRYTLKNLPKPKDPGVMFKDNPEKIMAVIKFSGIFAQMNFDKNINRLRKWMIQNKLEANGEPIIAGYDPPFTPWFLKHNEIMIEVKE
jgi:hypothetical protein